MGSAYSYSNLHVHICALGELFSLRADTVFDPGDYRLVDTADSGGGRAELLRNGIWGTVCVRNLAMSQITSCYCKALGLDGGRFRAFATNKEIGQGMGPIHASNVACSPEGVTVTECVEGGACGCDHVEDVYIMCVS